MNLTVLGKCPAWPSPGGASSGYLIQSGQTRILIDAGHGVASRLRESCEPHDLDAVVISHVHADHSADLTAIAYALKYMPHPRMGVRPLLLVPPGAIELLRALAVVWNGGELFSEAFRLREYTPARSEQIGDLHLTFAEVPHLVPTFAVDVRDADGTRLTYSADCGPNDALVDLARDTDLLLIEATIPEPDSAFHLTARQAGEHARRADADRCMLTHYADAYDPAWMYAQGRAGFGDSVELAVDGLTVTL